MESFTTTESSLADKVGMSREHFSRCKNAAHFTYDSAEILAGLLGISVRDVMMAKPKKLNRMIKDHIKTQRMLMRAQDGKGQANGNSGGKTDSAIGRTPSGCGAVGPAEKRQTDL